MRIARVASASARRRWEASAPDFFQIAAPVFIGAPSFTPGGSSLGYGEPVVMPTESALTAPPTAPAKPSPSKPVLNAPVVARSGDETKAQMARVNGDKSAFYQYLRPAGREPWRK